MSKNNRLLSFLILFSFCYCANAQYIEKDRWPYQEDKSGVFYYYCKANHHNLMIEKKYFRDTVSVDEMVSAFYEHNNDHITISPYTGRDSISGVWKMTILTDMLRQHPDKKFHKLRGEWSYIGSIGLKNIVDGNGNHMEKETALYFKNKKNADKWLDFPIIMLTYPQHYMGYVVSPHPYLVTYREGKITGKEAYWGPTDYFSLMGSTILDGEWVDHIGYGARQMSKYISEAIPTNINNNDVCEFPVLLYNKGNGYYSLQLLLQEIPDEQTNRLFENMKSWVEKLQKNLFCPYYTSDFRTFTGRYLNVHCDKNGWTINDYMKKWRK